MRINLYGNTCNVAYNIAKSLRHKRVDAHLFIEENLLLQDRPESDDPELRSGYPHWINVIKKLRYSRFGLREISFIRKLSNCDLIHVLGAGPIWAMWTGRPYVFQSYGADLSYFPFRRYPMRTRITAFRQRLGLKRARMVLYASFQEEFVRKLKLKKAARMPLVIDANKFNIIDHESKMTLRARFDCDLLIFHPTRHSWKKMSYSQENKGNDKLFRAFARLVQSAQKKILLITVEKGLDVDETRNLIRDLGIEQAVLWIPPVSREELIKFYNIADIVCDQFMVGDYGCMTVEAMSCGTPTFTYIKGGHDFLKEESPIVNVCTEEQIFGRLRDLSENQDELKSIGRKSREWVLRTHHWETVIDQYVHLYKAVLKSEKRNKIWS